MMASFRGIATGFLLLAILALCCVEARLPTLQESEALDTVPMDRSFNSNNAPCHARDISIQQGEGSGAGIPTWQVQIINQCTNPQCAISQVIVNCGAFHSASFVNPRVFRRFDPNAGTCIVNDGNGIPNAETVTFQYRELNKEPLSVRSAKVVCW